ncbi:MAG TPA: ABC transporter ATP-binding protein [Gemmatimonadaceae bacterium]|jgi:oligopeptide/dipeptide ABC transporter ATP-binding protein|nr:ABC transporter ATP-binding protein [Gemmatimonadaceae bacterium]
MTTPLLSVRDLRTVFDTDAGLARAVDGVSFDVGTGESVGLVGESGCGKSVTAFSILRLIRPPGRIVEGSQVALDGTDLMALDAESLRQIRGSRVSMVFQEPMTALNPVLRIGDQIAEVLRVHDHTPGKEARERAIEMLRLVGLSDPAARFDQYPHQLSGGMRQRVVIAMALVMHPELVLADEPTTALDVTVQAQILELLAELRERMGMAMLLITHDLGVIAESTSRVIVMYAGEVVEEAAVGVLFDEPHHPYTIGLLKAIPAATPADRSRRLAVIPGSVPPATDWPSGCRFRARCAYAWDRCEHERPPLYQIGAGHMSRCHLAEEPWRRS